MILVVTRKPLKMAFTFMSEFQEDVNVAAHPSKVSCIFISHFTRTFILIHVIFVVDKITL